MRTYVYFYAAVDAILEVCGMNSQQQWLDRLIKSRLYGLVYTQVYRDM